MSARPSPAAGARRTRPQLGSVERLVHVVPEQVSHARRHDRVAFPLCVARGREAVVGVRDDVPERHVDRLALAEVDRRVVHERDVFEWDCEIVRVTQSASRRAVCTRMDRQTHCGRRR